MHINSIVNVGAVFQGSNITPKWFIWEGRKYDIKSVDYSWSDHQGQEKIVRFSVSDGNNAFELAYNTARMSWSLDKVSDE